MFFLLFLGKKLKWAPWPFMEWVAISFDLISFTVKSILQWKISNISKYRHNWIIHLCIPSTSLNIYQLNIYQLVSLNPVNRCPHQYYFEANLRIHIISSINILVCIFKKKYSPYWKHNHSHTQTILIMITPNGINYSGSDGKEPACNSGDPGLITRLGRSPGEGNRYPLRYPCLEKSMVERGAWQATSPWGRKVSEQRTQWLTHTVIQSSHFQLSQKLISVSSPRLCLLHLAH